MSLSKLPSEVLSCVLNNQAMPLGRRLYLRLLCNRWADIIEDGLRKMSSLVILEKVHFRKPKPDDLVIKSTDLTAKFIRPLSRLFTSLTKLTLLFGVRASWNKLPSLLVNLDTTNLTTVKLYGFGYEHEPIEVIAIAYALNGLSRLTSLTLDGYELSVLLLPHLKPVLSRLEKFACLDYSTDLPSILSSSLSPRCTHLSLHSYDFQFLNRVFIAELSHNLTHLHLLLCGNTTWQSLSQMHHGLSSLALHFTGYPALDPSLFSHIAPFTRLTQVKLLRLKCRTSLALPSMTEKPLLTVKCLTLEVDYCYSPVDYQGFLQAISAWFPNLAKLTILTWSDTIPAIKASIGKLSFSVEIGDRDSVETWPADW